jgi:hypothetical protein
MPLRFWLRLAAFCAAAILAASLFYSWRAQRRDRALLAGDLAKTQQALSAATARQLDRDQQLSKLLATFEERKRTVLTPAEIIRQLPRELPLPLPLALPTPLQTMTVPSIGGQHAALNAGAAPESAQPIILPAADLKPLYNFAVDCNACRASLAAATSDLADERIKSAAMGRERDSALQSARGGSIFRRVVRATKWFVIGATAGAVASRFAR